MRDAFGGVFMIRLFLVFIVIYVAFSAVSLNYAKAFRIKNKIIDLIEENEVTSLTDFNNEKKGLQTKLDTILNDSNYSKECTSGNGMIKNKENKTEAYCYNGIVIEVGDKVNNTQTYIIHTYADWNLGSLNMILALGGQSQNSKSYVKGTWEITGEAKVVTRKK